MARSVGYTPVSASVVFRPLPVMHRTVVSSGSDAVLTIEFACGADGYAAGGLGEDAFGFGQQFDGVDQLRIADVLAPSAAAFDGLIA
jgi:hypothetical protein